MADVEVVGSADDPEELVRHAFELELGVKEAIAEGRAAYWRLAERLYQFHEQRGWELLGYDTISEWLAQPEIELSKTAFYRAVNLWHTLVVMKQLPPAKLQHVEPSKAREIAPAIARGDVDPDEAIEVISGPNALSYSDVVERFRIDRVQDHGQAPDGSTPLDAGAEPEYARCPMCGTRVPESKLPPRVGEESPRGDT